MQQIHYVLVMTDYSCKMHEHGPYRLKLVYTINSHVFTKLQPNTVAEVLSIGSVQQSMVDGGHVNRLDVHSIDHAVLHSIT